MISLSKLLDRPISLDGRKFDVSLLWMVILMTAFSLVMIYSASIAYAASEGGNQFSFVSKQAMFVGASVLGCLGLSLLSMSFWRKIIPFYFAFSAILLVVVLFVGREINGATRWIHIGPLNLQPTELFKLATVLYLSSLFTRREEVLRSMDSLGLKPLFVALFNAFLCPFSKEARRKTWQKLKKFKNILLPIVMVALGLVLVVVQPDFGSFVVIVSITMGMLFLAGFPWKYFAVLVLSVLGGMGVMILAAPYRMARVSGFLDPWDDPLGKGYQLTHSLMAIARGEWFGQGLGASLEKRFYLPEAHTDFIFAVIGEEFGFVGMCILVFCYGWLVMRAFSIGKQARDSGLTFSAYVANGIGIWIGIQSFFNIGVNIGILPTKGLTLPLMSYGGSAVAVMLVCVTLLLRVDYENRKKMRGYQVE
ncbi:putative peptidoglycan glycosyltransferase FtsW [Neisseria mucosa]|uniref:Probable peptidoglycan glycosyltransferase FtsW n=1 Tax=Neisseria mucosa TaxID=488 RepID=A0AAW6ZH16_NEIMU|nr:putative peptidoglycan glycosyltransferase FtsW [Neisseria mucosa]MDK6726728.1 putative peptidoglycan glycosyltransferase FtsW [Neisseria mucosa]MDK6871102.1 putative peptidoglycan glycosyltransferase FtsW [Neisseria mucosa]MDK8110761.1 putative peptidoglycan glycosyltransferase FtsW [Neisseria mucosa]MDK8362002.1 putative peptidoglycan glycosyltransferase FtsW [Neisseria mucosa]